MKKLLAFIFFLSSPVWATDRYLATNTNNGNDSNSCAASTSIMTPKRNFNGVNGALACMSAGDRLIVRGGTYAEFISTFSGSNVPSNATILAYDSVNEKVWLQPTGVGANGIFLTGTRSGITFDGINLDGINTGPAKNYGILAKDISEENVSNITFKNAEIKTFGYGIQMGGSTWTLTNLNIHDTIFVDCGSGGCSGYGIYMGGSNNVIEKSHIHHNPLYGVQQYNGFGGANNNIIRNNLIEFNGATSASPAGIASDGILIGSGTGNAAYNNILNDNDLGIECGAGTNCAIYNNTIYLTRNYKSVGPSCIRVEGSNGTLVKNNICYSIAGGLIDNNGSGTVCTGNFGPTSGCSGNSGANPLFVTDGTNFHLQSGSAARGIGDNLTSSPPCPLCSDYDGIGRPSSGAWDAGALQFSGTGPPTNLLPLEDFNYTTSSNLSGANGGTNCTGPWTISSGTITVDAAPAGSFSGGNAAHSQITTGSNYYYRQCSSVGTGIIPWQMRTSVTNQEIQELVLSQSDNSNLVNVMFRSDGHLYACGYYGSQTDLGTYNANQWYLIKVELDAVGHSQQFRVSRDNGTFSAWINFCQTGVASQFDRLILYDSVAVAHDFWVDTIGAKATLLAFQSQPPGSVTSGQAFSASVAFKYSDGTTTNTSITDQVTITICPNSPSGSLSGTLIANAVAGVATFNNLIITAPNGGSGYKICANAVGMTEGMSNSFNIPQTSPPSITKRLRARVRIR